MDIRPSDTTVKVLLSAKCQFEIPRFQRDYSWEKTHYQEFLDDMLESISFEKDEAIISSYFFGTMLFIGSLDRAGGVLKVVDGQQRLTTVTILFSALSDHFREINNEKLSERVFDYIMSEDDNGNSVRILKSESSYPFFSYYIQDRYKQEHREAVSEEEECIKDSFNYLYKRTSEDNLRAYLKKRYGKEYSTNLTYEDLLKAIRDQVLSSSIIAICTGEKKDANKIFEILNAKGKKLASVDLIKNKIFEILAQTEPVDIAEEKWKDIKKHLYSGKNTVGLATFFRHYWSSKYPNTSETALYDMFIKKVGQNASAYNALLDDLQKNAKYYSQIINPSRKDYCNKKEYYWLVQSLMILSEDFNIVQIRTLLLSLFDAKQRGILKEKDFKSLILYLEGFHFAYNALLARRPNILNSNYTKYARIIRKSESAEQVRKTIEELRNSIDMIYPSYQDFKEAFVNLKYSKKDDYDNIKTKYAVNKLDCFYSKNKREVFAEDGSIEHLLPESFGKAALGIGNLILLEYSINNDAGDRCYDEKRTLYYNQSSYDWVNLFISKNETWNESGIEKRAEGMAKVFYERVLGRN